MLNYEVKTDENKTFATLTVDNIYYEINITDVPEEDIQNFLTQTIEHIQSLSLEE